MSLSVDSRPFRSARLSFITALAILVFAYAGLPAAAQAAGSLYATSLGFVSQYAIGAGGALSPLSPATVPGRGIGVVAVSPDGRSAYVTNPPDFGAGTVSQYDVDPLSGALSPKTPPTVATGAVPGAIAVTPDGKSAYLAVHDPLCPSCATNALSQFDIDPVSGALSPKTPASLAGIAGDIAVTPDNKSAYVTKGTSIAQYDIDPRSGALSPKTPASVREPGAGAIAVTPDGKSAYAVGNGTVLQFDIDPRSGALSPKTPASVAAILNPIDIAITPDGRSTYVTNFSSIAQYDIDQLTGKLSFKSAPIAPAGVNPFGIAVSPDGRSAYAATETIAGQGIITQYDIDPVSGALSPKTPAYVFQGFMQPHGLTAGPLPRVPTSKEQCMDGGWRNFPQFKNQGECVAFVERGK